MLPQRYKPLTNTVIPGGFGTVQKVLDTYLDRTVLFKSMQDHKNNAQLINEVQTLSKARSRHVVEIYDVIYDERGNVAGIIIELLKGRDYLTFHNEAQASPALFIRALYQIGTAIADLHKVGIIHRDIKLDNLKESQAGVLKLFDFGISIDGPDYRTQSNRGTLVYAAPELYVPQAVITKEMDIYALGVCAWALATQTWPTVLLERPPQTSKKCQSIEGAMPKLLSAELVELIDSCLSPDPSDRPDAASISEVLGRHLVRGQHRGIFVQGAAAVFELSSAKPNVKIKIGVLGAIKVTYDQIVFRIDEVEGAVFVNNDPAVVGMVLHNSCVITFGLPTLGASRQWVTFSSSHPEVVL
jgi:eukaryotic-like serine/threonine-protein kinase